MPLHFIINLGNITIIIIVIIITAIIMIIRNNDKANHSTVQGYGFAVHTDYHPHTANNVFLSILQSSVKPKKGRFAIVNAWRNISDQPITQNDLALCDARSLVAPDDFIDTEFKTEAYGVNLQYRLNYQNAHRHRWYYYPLMTKDEFLLFKQYDSKRDITGRYCFHSALNSPSENQNLPTRQSIEVRVLLFFAQTEGEVNTCPEIGHSSNNNQGSTTASLGYNPFKWVFNLFSPSDISIEEGCRRCENAIVYLSYWPKDIVIYVKARKGRPEAAEELAVALAEDKQNHLKMRYYNYIIHHHYHNHHHHNHFIYTQTHFR